MLTVCSYRFKVLVYMRKNGSTLSFQNMANVEAVCTLEPGLFNFTNSKFFLQSGGYPRFVLSLSTFRCPLDDECIINDKHMAELR